MQQEVPLHKVSEAALRVSEWLSAMAQGKDIAGIQVSQDDVAMYMTFIAPAVVEMTTQLLSEIRMLSRYDGMARG
jgi:hypothetical protein